ncbi:MULTISPECIES: bestrophin family protein [Dyella]|uniref:Bestrophin n=2 Tax=Dyella TaxID=231454 RepID=A0A4R0YJE1_9GAMM|nr:MULTISPECIES: bestrophin family protein [Dyella]TBR36335.1 bestrophin [Dyella terrae]TCI05992.1 bestrophin [Dyella soli]
MIVRERPGLRDIFFALRGSILPRVAPRLAVIGLVSLAAVWLVRAHPDVLSPLSGIPFTLIGIALSIFMSFRNNACYDRWWEGRKLWGQLIISSRSLARQTATLDEASRAPVLRGLCAFAHGLSARLRSQPEAPRMAPWVTLDDAGALPNPTDAVLREIGAHCQRLVAQKKLSDIHYSILETQLSELAHVQGACERIAGTPLPFAYSLLLHRTAHLFCLALPFAIAGTLGWWTPLPVLLISYTFFGLDALGDELVDPFGVEPNDLPLDAMARTVERDMRAAMGETDLPPPLQPDKFVLL